MNEGVFGQYSVFCVFGSVVACVVVPLIAQLLQQQSMECMILSAIVVSLAAAHLNKKCTPTVNQQSKITFTNKENDKKRIHHSNNKKVRHNNSHLTHCNNVYTTSYEQVFKNDTTYVEHEKNEHLKVIEMEKKQEEKRIRKLQKREEKLKRKEEANKKQKEFEDRYKLIKEKRLKESKERHLKQQYLSYETDKVERNDGLTKKTNYFFNLSDSMVTCNRTKKRFNKNISLDSSIEKFKPKHRNTNLSIRCSSRTASCSSLSSISSSDSSVSPPLPMSPPCTKTAWKSSNSNVTSSTASWNKTHIVETVGAQSERLRKSYSNSRFGMNHSSLISSSLFSSNTDGMYQRKKESTNSIGEYTLFGPQHLQNPPMASSMF